MGNRKKKEEGNNLRSGGNGKIMAKEKVENNSKGKRDKLEGEGVVVVLYINTDRYIRVPTIDKVCIDWTDKHQMNTSL